MKKALTMLLCLLLVLCPLLVACNGSAGEDSSAAGTSGTSNETSGSGEGNSLYTDANGRYTLDKLNMPAFDFSQTEFRVCVYSNNVQTTYFSEEIESDLYSTTDNQLNEGVRNRNNRIAEKYGVTVTAYAVDDVSSAIRDDISAHTGLFDAAMPFMTNATALAQDGALYDLNTFSDYIHLDAPWWDQQANASLSIANKLYFTTGDISIMQKIVSTAVLFNRSMYAEQVEGTFGDMYQLVRDHKWTIDVMYEMGKMVTADVDGVSGMQFEDNWGMTGVSGINSPFIGGGFSFIDKDANDIPQIAIGRDEASVRYAQKLLQIYESDEWFFNTQHPSETHYNNLSIWETAMAHFGEMRSLFYGAAFSAVKKLRNYEVSDSIGFIPQPLSSDTQDEYRTCASISYAYGVCIPKSIDDPEFAAYMLEALACYAKDDITPAYYNSTLLDRDARLDANVEMLDQYIFNNVIYDLGILYNFGNISSTLTTLHANSSDTVASELDKIRSSVQTAIDECVEKYEMNG